MSGDVCLFTPKSVKYSSKWGDPESTFFGLGVVTERRGNSSFSMPKLDDVYVTVH